MRTAWVWMMAGLVAGRALAQTPITASSEYDARYPAACALDGDPGTRWASAQRAGTPEWLQVDFGEDVPINSLAITWERAWAVDYEVQVSPDGQGWTSVRQMAGAAGGTQLLEGLNARGRYLRLLCTKPTEFVLYSVWEIASPDPATAEAIE
ncbi:MAG: discoidin domain-containing protein, partial [Armatimonadetes bacterium]|nr:discoidin domain-containing protein [Armatimonadota bacterium]